MNLFGLSFLLFISNAQLDMGKQQTNSRQKVREYIELV